jgi:hypothetical protein
VHLATPSKQRQNRVRHRSAPHAALNRILACAGYLRLPGKGAKPSAAGPRPLRMSFMGGKSNRLRSKQGSSQRSQPASIEPTASTAGACGEALGVAPPLGAVGGGGAIAGDAGKGAAAGAAMGGLAGGFRRCDQRLQQNQQQQATSQAAANSQQSQRTAYDRAIAACLTGRGYTVN